jgi:sulfur-oxidizing protein SoxY
MNSRRNFLKKTLALASSAIVISVESAQAQWLAENFAPNLLDDAEKPAAKNLAIIDSDKIEIKLPKIAEKDIAIPITVSSSLDNVQTISILVEKNPVPLVATFRLSSELEAFVSARLKMLETSNIIVIVETREGLYRAKEQVKVIIGGCGS